MENWEKLIYNWTLDDLPSKIQRSRSSLIDILQSLEIIHGISGDHRPQDLSAELVGLIKPLNALLGQIRAQSEDWKSRG